MANMVIAAIKPGLYQRGWSKATMNVSRYSAKGATHKNGITATSVQTWLVVANSVMDAAAGNSSHKARCQGVGTLIVVSAPLRFADSAPSRSRLGSTNNPSTP